MRYESANLKQEASAALQTLVGAVILALVPLGVAGSIYKAISPNGWVAQSFGQSISAGAAILGSLAIVLAMAWFSRVYRSPARRDWSTPCNSSRKAASSECGRSNRSSPGARPLSP